MSNKGSIVKGFSKSNVVLHKYWRTIFSTVWYNTFLQTVYFRHYYFVNFYIRLLSMIDTRLE